MKWALIVMAVALAGCTVRKPGPFFCLGCTINNAAQSTTTTTLPSWK